MRFEHYLPALDIQADRIELVTSRLDPEVFNTLSAGPFPLSVRGQHHFLYPADPPSEAASALEVELVFEKDASGELVTSLCYLFPDGWKFEDTFPDLPEDFFPGLRDEQKLAQARFYLSTHTRMLQYGGVEIKLQKGLHFCAHWSPGGALGLIDRILGGGTFVIHGPVILDETAAAPELSDEQLPWDANPPNPGWNLVGELDLSNGLPMLHQSLTQASAGMKLYSPLSQSWLEHNPGYEPVMAYTGWLAIPGTELEFHFAALHPPEDSDELIVKGSLRGGDRGQLSELLSLVTGGEDPLSIFPPEVGVKLGGIELRDAAVHLLMPASGVEVAFISILLDLGSLAWPLFDSFLEIKLTSARMLIASPFEGQNRAITATISGEVTIGGVEFLVDVSAFLVDVSAPDYYLHARQVEPPPDQPAQGAVRLRDFLSASNHLPAIPIDILIDGIEFIAKPGDYYSFSMRLAAGKTWKLGKHSLPEVRVSVSSAGWQLEAAAPAGAEGFPALEILGSLIEKIGIEPFDLPASLEKLAISDLTLAYQEQSHDYLLICEGRIPLVSQHKVIEATISVEIQRQADGTYNKVFGGSILLPVGREAPLEFDLNFSTSSASSTFLAIYHDPAGRQILVQDLVQEVLDTEIDLDVTFSIHDALLAYQRGKDDSAGKLLFGLDIESGLNLSHIHLDDLPLIQFDPLPPEQSLQLAFQLFIAHGIFDEQDVDALTALLGSSGLNLPPQGIQRPWELATTLRIGNQSKLLSLPIPPKELPGAPQGVPLPAVAQPDETAQASQLATRSASQAQWISIQKSFGPLYLSQIGLEYRDGKIIGMLDALITIGGLAISLDGLTVESKIKEFDPIFSLHGLGISYQNGPLEIGAAFLKQSMTTAQGLSYTAFAGLAILRTSKLALSAIGSYTSLDDHPSLYIYALLDYPLGGPAFFFVTGLAAGFGYNRRLLMPSIEQVATFPLIEDARRSDAPQALPSGGDDQPKSISDQLARMEAYIPPALGEHFLAIGIRFTSFKQIDSFALLIVKFGARFEIDLLGISTLTAPAPLLDEDSTPGKLDNDEAGSPLTEPLAHAEMVIKATFIPDEGFLAVEGRLTSNSYILSKACHLSGGFAFYSWFSGEHAGDFVFTLGGYHPRFQVPRHYPVVPRLALSWQVDPHLFVKGDGYFALTSHALMAGGHLEATFTMGNFKAWFKAGLDFILSWQPFFYDAEIYASIGVSYTFHVFGFQKTVKVELGASLHVWGPEFSGTAELHYYLFDKTIEFGSKAPRQLPALKWDPFQSSFLPPSDQLCGISVQGGLVRQIEEGGNIRWILNPKDLELATHSVIPITESAKPEIAIAPMGIEPGCVRTTHTISIYADGDEHKQVTGLFSLNPVRKSVPAALWGSPRFTDAGKTSLALPEPEGKNRLVQNTLAGYEIRPEVTTMPSESHPVDRKTLLVDEARSVDAFHWEALGQYGIAAEDRDGAGDRRASLLEAMRFPDARLDFAQPAGAGLLADPHIAVPGREAL